MTTLKPVYASPSVSLFASGSAVDGLANGASWQSASIDNTVNLYDDYELQLSLVTAASGLVFPETVLIYVWAATPDASGAYHYPDGITGIAGSYTPVSPTNLTLVKLHNMPSVSTSYPTQVFTIASAFGGAVPSRFGLVIINTTGAAFGTGNAGWWTGVQIQGV